MPSPIGHLLAGVATTWAIDPRADRRLILTAAGLAALPDLDLILPLPHRTVTHSVVAVVVVTIIAAVVTRQVTRRPARSLKLRVTAICGAAYASHLLLDWLGSDNFAPYGIQALWPFSDRFYISGWGVFRLTARANVFTAPMIVRNVTAVAQEIAIMGTIVWALWLVRVKPLARFPAELTGGHHPAE
jgi:inner membrane protein